MAHLVATIIAYASRTSPADAIVELPGEEEYRAAVTVGALGMLLITFLSLGFVRRHLAYETWYFIHLLIYASLALAFAHEIYLGSDFAFDQLARGFWIAVSLLFAVMVIGSRWGRAIRSIVRPLTVLSVTPLNDVAGAIATSRTCGRPRAGSHPVHDQVAGRGERPDDRAAEIVHHDEPVTLAAARNGRIIPVVGCTGGVDAADWAAPLIPDSSLMV